jgi:hypothetical protein
MGDSLLNVGTGGASLPEEPWNLRDRMSNKACLKGISRVEEVKVLISRRFETGRVTYL